MNEHEQQFPTEVRTALHKCFAQIRLARATELARSERFLEAKAMLLQDGKLPDSSRELDLLARIAASGGHFDDARRLWNKALQKEPDNEIYKQCLECLTLNRRIGRLIASSQDTILNILVWATIAFGICALVSALRG